MPYAKSFAAVRAPLLMLAISTILFLLRPGALMPRLLGATAVLLLLLWLAHPAGHDRVQKFMERLALAVAAILSLLAMACMYFLVLTPVAFVLRCAGRDLLGSRLETAPAASQWQQPYRRSYDDDFFRAQF